MAKKIKDAAVKVGEYNGKAKWKNVGSVLQSDKGTFLLLDRTFNPAGCPNPDGKDSVLISFFDLKEKEDAPAEQSTGGGGQTNDTMEDEIPFVSQFGI